MRSARHPKKRKSAFAKKIKTFFVYTFVSIVVLGFFLNTFLSNILEYSFALADSGGIVDIKTDQKYSVALISSNKLKEVKEVSVITYDKKNSKLVNFNLSEDLLLSDSGSEFKLGNIVSIYGKSTNKINEILSSNLGTSLAFTYVLSSDDFSILEKILLGDSSILDIYQAKDIENISLRDLYFIYSFAGKLESKDKRELAISSFDLLDRELRDIFIDSEIGSLGESITVINTTNVNGMGKKFARIVGNLGGRVVDVDSTSEQLTESFIIYKEKSDSLLYLSEKLGIKKSLSMDEVGLKYPQIIKSDLLIVLGIDKVEK